MPQQPSGDPSPSSPVISKILEQSARVLETYRVDSGLIQEHANGERRITQGGYGDRQLFEIVQNAADEIANEPGGTVHVVLTEEHLYCANQGTPVTPEGTETILRMGVSRKRGGQIGRFGVGVKSYLVVTDAPQFFSETGSFGFDRAWSRAEIARIAAHALEPDFEAPVLRMARPLDEAAERKVDKVLDELRSWATTVVRLPLLPGAAKRLANDIHNPGAKNGQEEFPKLFQLFSSHVGKVVLEDRQRMPVVRRVISVEQDGERRIIHEKGTGRTASSVSWKVFTAAHQPTAAARGTAGELHDRATIDVSWAVPEFGGALPYAHPARGRGTFWSFFPTKYEMTLSGALNGAWKTNEDRQNLLDSNPFNQELLQVAAKLVVTSLPELAPAEDPGAYLVFLPGRDKTAETLSWADALLTKSIWKLTAILPSLPDQDGCLRVPGDLRIHPDEGRRSGKVLKPEWLRMWSACPGRPTDWLHPSVEATELRSGKVEHILDAAGHRRATVIEWLEALVGRARPEGSAVAVRILADMITERHPFAEEARRARIVLTETGDLVAPGAGQVWRRSVQDGLRDDLVYVHPKLSDDPSLQMALSSLGIREADSRGRFVGVLDQGFADYSARDWRRFWELFRRAGGSSVVGEIHSRFPQPLKMLHVLALDGAFHPMRNCLLPGPIVPEDGSRDRSVAVDLSFHSDDTAVFREFGLRSQPWQATQAAGESWYEEYRKALYEDYCRTLGSKSRPSINRMTTDGSAFADSLHLLLLLSDEGRAAFVQALPDHLVVERWTRQIGAAASARSAVPSPLRWMVRKYGMLPTSQGLRRPADAVGPQLTGYADVLPVAKISEEKARKLGLPTQVEQVPEALWIKLTEQLFVSEDDAFVGNTYVLMTRLDLPFPDGLTRCRIGESWGNKEDGEIAVAASTEEYRTLRAEAVPALLTASPKDAELLIDKWGMLPFAHVVTKEIRHVPSGESMKLVDAYPTLRQRLGNAVKNYELQYCSELDEITKTPNGMKPKPLKSALLGATVLVLNPKSRLDALLAADRELRWNLGDAGCRAVLAMQRQHEQNKETQQALHAVREADTVVEKLALLLGAKVLQERLPEGLLESERLELGGGRPSAERIAQMAYNSHGDGVLHAYAKDIQARFPNHAPSSFTGSVSAVKFVSDLQFPDAFAGFSTPKLAPRIDVDGPREFPRLHDYQERLAANIFHMLDRAQPQRGMLSLPTGAGKTRVTAEAVIRWIKQDDDLGGPILWIAQTEELCEQAVQSWKFVWDKVGAEKQLSISRLWSTNEAGPIVGRPQLVVATDAKLRNCLETDSYAWLRKAALVIVDEAHVAISPQYTDILAQLGLPHSRTERHLLGLTATPFRNTNEEQTRRLVQRFGGKRLDDGIFQGDPYMELQDLGMLARVEHDELLGGTIELTQDEKTRADQMSVLSRAAEQRLADDHDRNQRIIDKILAMPRDWPVLVFATSVSHAKFLAAKLNDRGITAGAVDSATSPSDRSNRIAAFRQGGLRVLTNYGVLTQGFDAPATRAVVVARPTYSPNVYQQMIGRGLRGPRNGGKEMCLILNVRDNITNYGKALAFTQFEHLWSAK